MANVLEIGEYLPTAALRNSEGRGMFGPRGGLAACDTARNDGRDAALHVYPNDGPSNPRKQGVNLAALGVLHGHSAYSAPRGARGHEQPLTLGQDPRRLQPARAHDGPHAAACQPVQHGQSHMRCGKVSVQQAATPWARLRLARQCAPSRSLQSRRGRLCLHARSSGAS